MINDYFNEINKTIISFLPIIKNYSKTEKIHSNKKGYLQGKIIFKDDSILSFMELKDIEKQHKNKYSYHFMDKSNNLIFRYDNAEYHPDINSFPHHKHIPDKIIEATEPELINILIEIYKLKMIDLQI